MPQEMTTTEISERLQESFKSLHDTTLTMIKEKTSPQDTVSKLFCREEPDQIIFDIRTTLLSYDTLRTASLSLDLLSKVLKDHFPETKNNCLKSIEKTRFQAIYEITTPCPKHPVSITRMSAAYDALRVGLALQAFAPFMEKIGRAEAELAEGQKAVKELAQTHSGPSKQHFTNHIRTALVASISKKLGL